MKITLATFSECFDWEALYVDGKLVCQGNCVTLEDLLEHVDLDIEFEHGYVSNLDDLDDDEVPDDLGKLVLTEECPRYH